MYMKKTALAFMALAMAVLSITSCGKTEPKEPEKPATIKVTGVTLDRQTLEITEGETFALTATAAPSNATDKSLTWSSNTTAVATVDGNGKVIAVKAGDATVTVTTKDGGKTATCKVTVKEKSIPATGLKVEPSSITFVEGQTKSLKATVTPSNSTDEVIWPSSTYLTSNGGGSYTAKKLDPNYVGFNLEVTAGSASAKASVMVYPMWFSDPTTNRIIADGATKEITKGDMSTFYFSKKKGLDVTMNDYIEKEILPAEDFSVSSSNSGVATVDKTTIGGGEYNGIKIIGIEAGTATITVTIGSVSRTMTIRVNQK
jgi:uncharacterized protein YjdB